jgi:hypothetical protein
MPTPAAAPWVSPKKGLPLTTGNCSIRTDCPDVRLVGASWAFTWGAETRLAQGCEDIDKVGMIWGAQSIEHGCPTLRAGSEYLLTFNEPDLHHMPPAAAAVLFRWVETCYPHLKLVAPAVVRDVEWVREMRDAYKHLYGKPPRFHALGLHCYPLDGHSLVDSCLPRLERLEAYARAWHVPGGIWINEWAALTDAPDWREQQAALLLRFEADPLVTRHAWYTARERGDEVWANGRSQLLDCDTRRLREPGIRYRNFRLHQSFLPIIYHHTSPPDPPETE